jgi:methionyl-tRNA formyltransferase
MTAKIVFMGSPAFAVPSFRALLEAGYEVVAAVTQPDRPAGRGGKVRMPEVKRAALGAGVRVERLREQAVVEDLRDLAPDAFVVAAYGKILPRAVLQIPVRGSVNVHASLLPRWRGPSPVAAAILAGDAETGVSIMELVEKMDAGPVIARAAVPIPPDATAASLEPQLAELGARKLVESLPGWLDRSMVAEPQDETQATYCPLLTKEHGHLRRAMSAAEAERAVRAYNPWPLAFVLYRGQRLTIWRGRVALHDPAPPGTTAILDHFPAVAFEGGWLVLERVQKPGGRPLSGRDFVNGERGTLEAEVGLA